MENIIKVGIFHELLFLLNLLNYLHKKLRCKLYVNARYARVTTDCNNSESFVYSKNIFMQTLCCYGNKDLCSSGKSSQIAKAFEKGWTEDTKQEQGYELPYGKLCYNDLY